MDDHSLITKCRDTDIGKVKDGAHSEPAGFGVFVSHVNNYCEIVYSSREMIACSKFDIAGIISQNPISRLTTDGALLGVAELYNKFVIDSFAACETAGNTLTRSLTCTSFT